MYRKNATISALSSGKLDKYEYLTGEDLGYRPDPVQKAKFEHSPLGQVFNKGLTTDEKSEGLLKRLKNIENKTDNQSIVIENNISNQSSTIKDGIKDRKTSDTKTFKFRDPNGNEIKELNYLIDYIDNSIEKYIKGKKFSVQTRSTKDGKNVYKNYNFSDYTDLWSLVKKLFEGKLSIKEARKKITELHNRLNPSGPGKRMKIRTLSTKKTLEDLHSNAKNLYIIGEDIINEMFNTEDEKFDVATGGDDGRRKSVIETISKLGHKEEPETGKGLRIMTPRQMITSLPILLAQKQAGNNCQKLNNEIRQIIYSLYRSKNLSKTVYNRLINSI